MTLELEMLVLAWDNYKKNVAHNRPAGPVLTTREEIDIEQAINQLVDKKDREESETEGAVAT